MKKQGVRLLFCLFVLSVSLGIASGGEYVREQGQNSLIYDPNPAPGEVAYWSGAKDAKGYATGFGVLTWYENGVKVSAYQGKKIRGKWKTFQEIDIGRSSSSARSEDVPENRPPTQNREERTGAGSQLARSIPAFLTRGYPLVDTASAIVSKLESQRNITEWGFQDMIAPAGTSVVKVKLFRSQVILENQNSTYMDGDTLREFQMACNAEMETGGSPMIIVTAYLDGNGSRIESLPVTIEFYGGYLGGAVSGSASAFRLSDQVVSAVRRGAAYALDPYDVRSVFSYSGMVSESGFNGIGYFTPLFLTHGESGWTRGKGYFGRFQSGEFVEVVSLESFGGPLAIAAQREAVERGAVIGELAGITLLGGMAIIAGGAIKLGADAWESVQRSAASSGASSSSGGSTSRVTSTPSNKSATTTRTFTVTYDERANQTGDEAGARGESSVTVGSEDGTFIVRYWYDFPSSILISAGRGKSLEGKSVTIQFEGERATFISCGAGNGKCEVKSFSRQ